MFKLKSDTELNFDSGEMQKTYFEQNQAAYPGYYHHQSTPNGYGGYDGQMGYNGTPPPEAHYRGNYQMQGVNSGHQGSAGSGHYGPLDYSQHPYNPQCNMPPNVSPTNMGVPGQPMIHPADPSMLKGHPHGMGHQGAGHHPGAQLGMPGQEIYPWMKEHRQQNKRQHQQQASPQGPGEYPITLKSRNIVTINAPYRFTLANLSNWWPLQQCQQKNSISFIQSRNLNQLKSIFLFFGKNELMIICLSSR